MLVYPTFSSKAVAEVHQAVFGGEIVEFDGLFEVVGSSASPSDMAEVI